MRFFIPSANDPHQAEEVYRKMRELIKNSGGSVSERRIYSLRFRHDGTQQTAMVGSDRHCFGNGPVLAIFEGPNGVHYVCTQDSGNLESQPHPVDQAEIIEAEEFSALA
jgi:hypothetical protein